MALKLNERYPGRFDNPSAEYPQGSFKNRTTPDAKDGSYLEKDWANDKEGFFQSLLSQAGIAANGAVDAVGASQYFSALTAIIESLSLTPPDASTTVKGIVALATSTETQAGTDAAKAVTPAGLASVLSGKQNADATLTALAALTVAANKLIYATGADTFATTDLSAFARTLLDDADAAEARATLGAVSSTDVDAKFTGTNVSLAANGYQRLPSGLIIQWGIITGVTTSDVGVTFPIAFPTNTVHVGIQARGDSNGPISGKEVDAPPRNITTTSFTLNAGPDTGYYGGVFLWFAIGY